jgi:hypothetical protein
VSFDSTAGTRGARQPAGFVFRSINTLMARRIRRKRDGKLMGLNALVLTTVGSKTGIERTTPVGWFPGPDGSWLIVASAPRFAQYQRKTDRELPIIRLAPRSGS